MTKGYIIVTSSQLLINLLFQHMQDTDSITKLHAELRKYPKSIKEVAQRMGVSSSRVSQILTGARKGGSDILAEAIKVLAERKNAEAKLNEQIETLTDEH